MHRPTLDVHFFAFLLLSNPTFISATFLPLYIHILQYTLYTNTHVPMGLFTHRTEFINLIVSFASGKDARRCQRFFLFAWLADSQDWQPLLLFQDMTTRSATPNNTNNICTALVPKVCMTKQCIASPSCVHHASILARRMNANLLTARWISYPGHGNACQRCRRAKVRKDRGIRNRCSSYGYGRRFYRR